MKHEQQYGVGGVEEGFHQHLVAGNFNDICWIFCDVPVNDL